MAGRHLPWVLSMVLGVVGIVVLGGCESARSDAPTTVTETRTATTTAESSDSSSAPSTSAYASASASASSSAAGSPVPADLTGRWLGTVTWADGDHNVVLDLTSSNPIRGTISVLELCSGEWIERDRNATMVRVDFRRSVGSGCNVTNTWRLTFSAGQITGVDSQDPNTRLRVTRD